MVRDIILVFFILCIPISIFIVIAAIRSMLISLSDADISKKEYILTDSTNKTPADETVDETNIDDEVIHDLTNQDDIYDIGEIGFYD